MSGGDRLAKLERLLAIDPNDAFVLYGLAQEHAKAGDHGRAVGFYDRCLAADPGYCYAYFHKAKSQQAMGNVAAARQTAEAGVLAAQRAGDGKALNELSGLAVDLREAR